LGARETHSIEIHSSSDENVTEALGHVHDANGVFLVSSDHARALVVLAGTQLVSACQERRFSEICVSGDNEPPTRTYAFAELF
jgi:cyanophycinase-like exopeptidase